MHSSEALDQLFNEELKRRFGIKKLKHVISDNKVTGIKFDFLQKNDSILELFNLYVFPAFILNSVNRQSTIRIGAKDNRTLVTKEYTKTNKQYVDSKQAEQQKENSGWWQKAKSLVQSEEKIEFIELNKNFNFNNSESTKVEITFAGSEVDVGYVKKVLECISNFKKLMENNVANRIKVNHHFSIENEQEDKQELNIYPFFAKKMKGKESEIVFCLASEKNTAEFTQSIFGNDQDQCKIECNQKEFFFSYGLDSVFLGNFVQFFNEKAKTITERFCEKIKKIANNEIEINIKNITCSTSSIDWKDSRLQLNKTIAEKEEKLKFSFNIGINDRGQIEKVELDNVYNAVIYKIVSLISFFDLCLNKGKFSISIEVDGKNISTIQENLVDKILNANHYGNLVYTICDKLRYHACQQIKPEEARNINIKEEVLKFLSQKVTFQLEAESKSIKLDNIEPLIGYVSVLNAQSKAFLDIIDNPSVQCYLSNFFYTNNKISCVYVVIYPKDLPIEKIKKLDDQFKESFSHYFSNLKQVSKDDRLLAYSIAIDIGKLLNNSVKENIETGNDQLNLQNIIRQDVSDGIEIGDEMVEENADVKSQFPDWQFAKIKDAHDFNSFEQGLKEACTVVNTELLKSCNLILEQINALQLGREQVLEPDPSLMSELDVKKYCDNLEKNLENYAEFISKKINELKKDFSGEQKNNITQIGSKLYNTLSKYKEIKNILYFISREGACLSGFLEKNITELERLIDNIDSNNLNRLVQEVCQFSSDSVTSLTEKQKEREEHSQLNNDHEEEVQSLSSRSNL